MKLGVAATGSAAGLVAVGLVVEVVGVVVVGVGMTTPVQNRQICAGFSSET